MGTLQAYSSWPRAIVRAWIILWMLAVPLFHVHPEADHHHGEAGHVHGGTVHTVFSPDLDGEFHDHQDAFTKHEHQPGNQIAVSGHPAHASDNTEQGFSFVSDSTDRTLLRPLTASALIVEPPVHAPLATKPSAARLLIAFRSLTVLTQDIPSRAPPSPLA
ncbi:MAG: hypothetical protein LZF86_190545 [Nitrospira sp.]|nr:MAG: hypothetical protein LZF86_190545 [Nitrospira sp.]